WQAHGVRPDAVIGHSQGEIAAACVAGALSLEYGARVVVLRSRAIAELLGGRGGGMLSVGLSAAEVAPRLAKWPGRISVAADNGTRSAVLSGDGAALDELAAELIAGDIRAKRVPVDYASHSGHVDDLRERLRADLAALTPGEGTVPMVSTVTGSRIGAGELDADYWFANLRGTVRFAPVVRELVAGGHAVFVEVSPHPVLTMSVQETADELDRPCVVAGTLRRDEGGPDRFARSAAELYVRGARVDWSAFPPRGRTVDLPTYPFQHKRFWITPEGTGMIAEDTAAPVVPSADDELWDEIDRGDTAALAARLGVADEAAGAVLPALAAWHRRRRLDRTVDSWRYRVRWQPVPVTRAELTGSWLVVVPGDAVAAGPVLSGLAARGARVVAVEAGDPERGVLADRLRAEAAGARPAGILSLLALGKGDPILGTLTLLQAVDDVGDLSDVPCWVLTSGAIAVDGLESADPAAGALWGMGSVLALDRPGGWGGMIDLDGTGEHAIAGLCAALSGLDGEDQLAVRRSGVLARRLVRAPRDTAPAGTWRPRGTVLVTGGTGAVGGHVARWLAGAGAERLVLTSRRGMAADGAAELVAGLTELGVEATVEACDVADEDAMRALLDGLPELTAVLHAAGELPDEPPLAEVTPEDFARAMRAKVLGAEHLDRLLGERPLEAFVVFSSGAAVWGTAGKPAYAAANAYLDALIHRRRAAGRPGTAVAWGSWGGGGMVDDDTAARLRRLGLSEMDPAVAVAALRSALDRGESHLVVADIDWSRFAPVHAMARPRPLLRALPEAEAALGTPEQDAGETSGETARRLATLEPADRAREVLALVRAQSAAVLGHDDVSAVEPGRAFKELGTDSVAAVDLRNRLAAVTGLRLPAAVVFDHATPKALAEHLSALLGGDETEAEPVLAAVDRLAALAAELSGPEIERTRIVTRLGAVLDTLSTARRGGDGEPPARLETASAEDMFALIDRELGT
ncbi:SDR family NAD(P)-dependent oxidoreductase, partial [Amycolatopsis sp. NPDC059021]|uniref:SDR family NAD(P)-dependent oxidoreductase n=1 Tax=Amycolatopsis sp. NPDC059021 TaxID=3346704 RepID=UPI00366E3856